MEDAFVSLQEAAHLIGKSVQTVRRMVKRGEISAQRMKTPQGFQYVVRRDELPEEELGNPTIETEEDELLRYEENVENEVVEILSNSTSHPTSQSSIKQVVEPINDSSTSQNEILINQHQENSCNKHESEHIDKMHSEIMGLIKILETMQVELEKERRRPRSLLAYIMDWLTGRS